MVEIRFAHTSSLDVIHPDVMLEDKQQMLYVLMVITEFTSAEVTSITTAL